MVYFYNIYKKNIIFMIIKRFNESNINMMKFVLTTTSESSDHYIYFIEHEKLPTTEELNNFLIEHGNDKEEGYSYEGIDMCVEIKDFKRIS